VLNLNKDLANCQDEPHNSDEYTVELRLGDVILTATDGVFDNLFNHEVLDIIKEYKQERFDHKQTSANSEEQPCVLSSREEATELAKRIAEAARYKVDGVEPPTLLRRQGG
jgi:serine/threonine protein phosphatase PrpC